VTSHDLRSAPPGTTNVSPDAGSTTTQAPRTEAPAASTPPTPATFSQIPPAAHKPRYRQIPPRPAKSPIAPTEPWQSLLVQPPCGTAGQTAPTTRSSRPSAPHKRRVEESDEPSQPKCRPCCRPSGCQPKATSTRLSSSLNSACSSRSGRFSSVLRNCCSRRHLRICR